MKGKLFDQFHEPSYSLRSDLVKLFITRRGGHMAPVIFDREKRRLQPFYINRFARNRSFSKLPSVLQVLRGDFFCLPFGGNSEKYKDESHPPHGETANNQWRRVSQKSEQGIHTIVLKLNLRIRNGQVTKRVFLRDGENVVYQEHEIAGMNGFNCPGHHPTLHLRSKGNIALSAFLIGSTEPVLSSSGETQSYSALKSGSKFKRLGKVPLIYGGETDLSKYPSRPGFTDIVQVVADPKLHVAWNTVTFPEERFLFFALRDPKVLRQTVLWYHNGGRHSYPWNGEADGVLGLEDVTAHFAHGLCGSVKKNQWNRQYSPTTISFDPNKPLSIRYIFGIVKVKKDFEIVKRVSFEKKGVRFLGKKGSAFAKVDWRYVLPAAN
jgi:hypothetical protein